MDNQNIDDPQDNSISPAPKNNSPPLGKINNKLVIVLVIVSISLFCSFLAALIKFSPGQTSETLAPSDYSNQETSPKPDIPYFSELDQIRSNLNSFEDFPPLIIEEEFIF